MIISLVTPTRNIITPSMIILILVISSIFIILNKLIKSKTHEKPKLSKRITVISYAIITMVLLCIISTFIAESNILIGSKFLIGELLYIPFNISIIIIPILFICLVFYLVKILLIQKTHTLKTDEQIIILPVLFAIICIISYVVFLINFLNNGSGI